MILAFQLSMPNCASWNGRWSGDGRKYVIVKTFRGREDLEKAIAIRAKGYYKYVWDDGWAAGITVTEVNSCQAARLRRESQGFCGYDWMVKTICDYGKPMATHEVQELLTSRS